MGGDYSDCFIIEIKPDVLTKRPPTAFKVSLGVFPQGFIREVRNGGYLARFIGEINPYILMTCYSDILGMD
jgi:hypothetical protein